LESEEEKSVKGFGMI